jgi:aspartate racemase
MARQLRAKGQEVALLVLFDTSGPARRSAMRAKAGAAQSALRYGQQLRRAVQSGQWQPLADSLRARWTRLHDTVVTLWHRWRGLPIPAEVRWRVVEASNFSAYRRYVEQAYDGRVTLFRAVDEPGGPNEDLDLGWSQVCRGGVEIIELPGYHRDFIEQPEVGHRLRSVLEAAQSRRPRAGSENLQEGAASEP